MKKSLLYPIPNSGFASAVLLIGLLTCTQLAAQPEYFSTLGCGQSSCHQYLSALPSAINDPLNPKDFTQFMPATCTGCHAHGTQSSTFVTGVQNLQAFLSNNQFQAGDTITVTLYGGNKSSPTGWFMATLYDASGKILDSNIRCLPTRDDCEFPVQLRTTAQPGMNRLYIGWLGRNYNKSGGQEPDTLGTGFGVGNRLSAIDSNHIEIIVATNTFSVTGASNSSKSNADTTAGAGNIEWIFVLAMLAMICLRTMITSANKKILTR